MPERSFGKFICKMSHSVEKRKKVFGEHNFWRVLLERGTEGSKLRKGDISVGIFGLVVKNRDGWEK